MTSAVGITVAVDLGMIAIDLTVIGHASHAFCHNRDRYLLRNSSHTIDMNIDDICVISHFETLCVLQTRPFIFGYRRIA